MEFTRPEAGALPDQYSDAIGIGPSAVQPGSTCACSALAGPAPNIAPTGVRSSTSRELRSSSSGGENFGGLSRSSSRSSAPAGAQAETATSRARSSARDDAKRRCGVRVMAVLVGAGRSSAHPGRPIGS